MKKLVMVLLLCAGAAWGQPSGGIPPRPQRVLFANLGTPQDSNWRYCTDCAATSPCTGSGAGAFAYRVGSAWSCNVGSPALATPVTAANGGTGQSTYTKGDMLAAPGGATLNKVAVGTDGFVWTADAASTNGVKWAAAAAGGANTALSNLASVAINDNLTPGTDATKSLGTTTLRWDDLLLHTSSFIQRGVNFFDATDGVNNRLMWTEAVGPRFRDGTVGKNWTLNLQNLSADRIVVTPDAAGTFVLDTATQTLSGKTFTRLTINTGITSGTGFQHVRSASCTTGTLVNAACDTTITWPVAFADTNYTAGATLSDPSGGLVFILSEKSKTTTTMVVTLVTLTAAASSGTVNAWAIHD